MFARVVKFGLLAALTLSITAESAEAFGRRSSSSSCSTPVYYPSNCYPIYCPPCPCPEPTYKWGWDCVRNDTKEYLRVHITSGTEHHEAIVAPGGCTSFSWRKDNQEYRVITAFNLKSNKLVAVIRFHTIDIAWPHVCTGPHRSPCQSIKGTETAVQMEEAPARDKMPDDKK